MPEPTKPMTDERLAECRKWVNEVWHYGGVSTPVANVMKDCLTEIDRLKDENAKLKAGR